MLDVISVEDLVQSRQVMPGQNLIHELCGHRTVYLGKDESADTLVEGLTPVSHIDSKVPPSPLPP